jgi:hypothetical protein
MRSACAISSSGAEALSPQHIARVLERRCDALTRSSLTAATWYVVKSGMSAAFDGVRVFSATTFSEREKLGNRVTQWLAATAHVEIADIIITQSSDDAFLCLAITVFYRDC